MSGERIASILTRKGSSSIIATASDFWETLTEFIKELHKINKKQIKISEFEIFTVGDYVAKYPDSEFSKRVKEQWRGESESNGE